MAYERNLKKEAEWAKKAYKRYQFHARRANGEADEMERILNGRSFSDWVREKMEEDTRRTGG